MLEYPFNKVAGLNLKVAGLIKVADSSTVVFL